MLALGVPVVTRAGTMQASRVAASLLHTLGLAGDLVAHSQQGYINLAVALATDPAARRGIRQRLGGASHALSPARFARNLLAGLTAAHDRYVAGLSPAAFNVTDDEAELDNLLL